MDESETLSLRSRRKRAAMSICCFHGGGRHHRADSMDGGASSPSLKGRCKDLMTRMGRYRRHSSADLTYDPLSYSRNFQDETDPYDVDDFAGRSFVSRLPVSPSTFSGRFSFSGSGTRAATLMMTPTSGSRGDRWFAVDTPKKSALSSSSSSMDLLTPSGPYEDEPRRVLVELC